MGGQIFFRGSYSEDQLTLLDKLLDKSSVFVDAGANQGEFTVAAARRVLQGRVYAFEPVSEYRERLIENVRLNGFRNVEILPVALGEQDGSLPIYDQQEEFTDGTRHEGLPTLFSSGARRHLREVVPVKRFDEMAGELKLSRIDVIKLDIEGAEWIALRGAINSIGRFRPVLILEIGRETCRAAGHEPEALVQWLAKLGYRVEKVVDGGQTEPLNPLSLGDFQNVVAYPS
jgi:FkbM family methyltransferase